MIRVLILAFSIFFSHLNCIAITIDDWSTPGFDSDGRRELFTLNDPANVNPTYNISESGSGILGGVRTVQVQRTSPRGAINVYRKNQSGTLPSASLQINVSIQASSLTKVTWDGDNLAGLTNRNGLGGVDFRADGSTSLHYNLDYDYSRFNGRVTWTFYEANSNRTASHTYQITLDAVATPVFVAFSSFSGSQSVFNNVGAITLELDSVDIASEIGIYAIKTNGTCTNIPTTTEVIDDCGICDGQNADKDDCGVCFGNNAAQDSCGVCFGNNAAQDDCGVCFGGNAGKDDCGICFGNNAGKDDCGICFGGDRDKDDCGVCFGNNAAQDDCGVCFGNNASKDSCGVCFGNNAAQDSCGVCFGNNAGQDDCGVCFGGNSAQDDCGICFGDGSSCAQPCAQNERDDCGVCFGNNAAKDSCGVCFGGERDKDSCGVCFGNDASKDDCGVCSGNNAAKDNCNVCFGDGTTCSIECSTENISVTELDVGSNELFNKTLKLRNLAVNNKAPKKRINALLADAQKANTNAWTVINVNYPKTVTTCTNAGPGCSTADISSSINTYANAQITILDIAKKIRRRAIKALKKRLRDRNITTKQFNGRRNKANNLLTKAKAAQVNNNTIAASYPTTNTSCSSI